MFYDGTRVLGGGWIERAPLALDSEQTVERRSRRLGRLTTGGASPIGRRRLWRSSSAVEQWNHNPWVGGSNPSSATNKINDLDRRYALNHVAHVATCSNKDFQRFARVRGSYMQHGCNMEGRTCEGRNGMKGDRETAMFTDAEDWLARLKAAGGTIRVDAATMYPRERPLSSECVAIWNEIRGTENADKWRQVEELLRLRVGGIVGWADL